MKEKTIYKRRFNEANVIDIFKKKSKLKDILYYIDFYEGGLKHLKKFSVQLAKLEKEFPIEGVSLPNGWGIALIEFKNQGNKDNGNKIMANDMYAKAKQYKLPATHDEWTNGDDNKIYIQLNEV